MKNLIFLIAIIAILIHGMIGFDLTTILEAINDEAMSVVSIQIECVVDEGLSAEKVLTNVAEISEDKNDSGTPDIDSTPDNKKSGEDDIDDAEVMLSISTGVATPKYTILTNKIGRSYFNKIIINFN